MNVAGIKTHDARARRRFTYQPDPPAKDRWRSFAAMVLAGKSWKGDCDDLTSTVLDLMARAGMPHDRLMRALVISPQSTGQIDHMVGIAIDEAGVEWVVGDTFESAHPRSSSKHRFVQVSRVSEKTVWRRV